jgi:hypothetical protein
LLDFTQHGENGFEWVFTLLQNARVNRFDGGIKMTVNRAVRAVMGLLALNSVALGAPSSPIHVSG